MRGMRSSLQVEKEQQQYNRTIMWVRSHSHNMWGTVVLQDYR